MDPSTMEKYLQSSARAGDRQRLLCFTAVFNILNHGRPMLLYEERGEEYAFVGHKDYSPSLWTDTQGWRFAEVLAMVVKDCVRQDVLSSRFFSISCDESTDIGKISEMSITIYYLKNWQRLSAMMSFVPTKLPATAANLSEQITAEVSGFLEKPRAELGKSWVGLGTDGAANMQGSKNGAGVILRRKFPFLTPIHDMAHRVDLSAKAVAKSGLGQRVSSVAKVAIDHYSHSTARVQDLKNFQEELEMTRRALLKIQETRWINHHPMLKRLDEDLPAVLLHMFHDAADIPLGGLREVDFQLGAAAMLPMLKTLNTLILGLQTEGAYIRHMLGAVVRCIDKLEEQYCGEDAWARATFKSYSNLMNCMGTKAQKQSSRWVLTTGEDMHGEVHDEKVLFVRVGDELMLMKGKHVPKPGKRASPQRQPVNKKQLQRIEAKIKEDAKEMVRDLIADLDSRFPNRPVLDALSIVDPQYWVDDDQDDFEELRQRLEAEYGVDKTTEHGEFKALIDVEKLEEQAEAFRELALHLAPKAIKLAKQAAKRPREGDAGDDMLGVSKTLKEQAGALTIFWRLMSSSQGAVQIIGEYEILAEALMTLVGGSVPDEGTFSAMAYVKKKERNALTTHLEDAMRLFCQRLFTLATFPFKLVLEKWHDMSARGRYLPRAAEVAV